MMAKNKRRTKAQKIIAQLRRDLEKQQRRTEKKIGAKPKIEASARKKLPTHLPLAYQTGRSPITNNLYTYDQSLVKKDLLKTFFLSLIFFSLIGIFYWYFQAGGGETILAISTSPR